MAFNFPLEGSGSDEKYAGAISFTAINTSTGAQRAEAAGIDPNSPLTSSVVGSNTVQTYGNTVNLYLPQGITI